MSANALTTEADFRSRNRPRRMTCPKNAAVMRVGLRREGEGPAAGRSCRARFQEFAADARAQ